MKKLEPIDRDEFKIECHKKAAGNDNGYGYDANYFAKAFEVLFDQNDQLVATINELIDQNEHLSQRVSYSGLQIGPCK